MLSSSGLIQNVTPNKLGVYTLIYLLINDRLVYVRETPSENLALVSGFDPDTREYDFWMVRYAILIKHSIFLRLSNHLTIKVFNSFFINLQIVRENLNSHEDVISSRPVLNRDCRDKELPANGDCDDGWHVMINSTHISPDETASIECLHCKI